MKLACPPSSYTKEQRAALVADFTRARRLIAAGAGRYICHALHTTRAVRIIQARMGFSQRSNCLRRPNGCTVWRSGYTLQQWLLDHKHIEQRHFSHWKELDNETRKFRLRWLDHLIKEFSA